MLSTRPLNSLHWYTTIRHLNHPVCALQIDNSAVCLSIDLILHPGKTFERHLGLGNWRPKYCLPVIRETVDSILKVTESSFIG